MLYQNPPRIFQDRCGPVMPNTQRPRRNGLSHELCPIHIYTDDKWSFYCYCWRYRLRGVAYSLKITIIVFVLCSRIFIAGGCLYGRIALTTCNDRLGTMWFLAYTCYTFALVYILVHCVGKEKLLGGSRGRIPPSALLGVFPVLQKTSSAFPAAD